ncbi:MAG TPA: cell division protein FtsQ/DivIB [Allosphingosinicella sp.]|nr:cell division protein FtsQ/DivIB [Allosphingosinicella sp.]
MTARIARGSAAAKPRAASKPVARGKPSRKQQPGMLDGLPVAGEAIRRVGLWVLGGMLIALGVAVAVALQVPQMVGTAIGEGVGSAGFVVKRVEPKGLDRMNPMEVYLIAADQIDRAMPLVDLDGTRRRLLQFGWVEDARVSRRWPDTLVVDIIERKPAAIWQHNQRLILIARDGVVLEEVKLEAMPDLPLVIGPAANRHAGELNILLDAAPELRPMIAGATWVGGRRWDLRFQSGEALALPEGVEAGRKALTTFARMDKATQLLGRGFARFDMRIPGKFIVRLSNVPGTTVPVLEPEPVAPGSGPIDPATTI